MKKADEIRKFVISHYGLTHGKRIVYSDIVKLAKAMLIAEWLETPVLAVLDAHKLGMSDTLTGLGPNRYDIEKTETA